MKYRGKTKTGEWKYGFYFYSMQRKSGVIVTTKDGLDIFNEVEVESVSQFTGFKDIKGKDIYDNDNVRIEYEEGYFTVKWTDNNYGTKLGWGLINNHTKQEYCYHYGTTQRDFNECEIINT